MAGKKIGRPSCYNPDEHPRVARELTKNGKTLADMAEVFGVTRQTLDNWMDNHPEFLAQVKLGREDATDRVVRALFERAIGYEHPAVKILAVSEGQGAGSRVEKVPYTEHYPPDPVAAKFFLTNRRAKEWRERQEVEHSGEVTLTLEKILASSTGELVPTPETPPADA